LAGRDEARARWRAALKSRTLGPKTAKARKAANG
jgi:hypothetical protein